jgi:hypothetical protein
METATDSLSWELVRILLQASCSLKGTIFSTQTVILRFCPTRTGLIEW